MGVQSHDGSTESTTLKILILDDNEEDFYLAHTMLKEARGQKFEVQWAGTYAAGRQALFSNLYHAVLVDYDLGDHSGIELIREANQQGYPAPLILYTGRGSFELDLEAMQAGAALYLTKGETSALMLERAIRYAIEHKRTEQALAESEQRYRGILETTGEGVAIHEPDGTISYVNQRMADLLGYSREEIVGRSSLDFVDDEEREAVIRARASVKERGGFSKERKLRRKDGSVLWTLVNVSPRRDDAGNFLGYLALHTDITERKQAEAALSLAHERLRRFVDADIIGVVVANAAGAVLETNDYYLRLIGFTREEFNQGKVDWRSITPPEWQWVDERALAELRAHGTCTPFEKEYVRRDGTRVSVFIVDALLPGEHDEIASFVLDITARRQAEKALRESEARFRALLEASSDVVYRMSPDWTEMRYLYGRDFIADTEEPSRTWLQQYIHPDDQPHVQAAIDKAIRARSVFELEHRVLRRDGSLGWTVSRAIPILDQTGEITDWFAMASDITERKQAEEALRESEERFRLSLLGGNVIIALCDRELRYVWIYAPDPDFEPSTVIGKRDTELADNDGTHQLEVLKRSVIETGARVSKEIAFPLSTGIKIYNIQAEPHFDHLGRVTTVTTVAVDITERKQAEEALRRSEALYRTLAAHLPGGAVFLVDHDLRYVLAEGQALEQAGFDRSQFEGRTLYEVLDPDLARSYEPNYRQALAGEPFESEHQSHGRHYNTKGVPVRDADGRVTHVLAMSYDITERKRVEAALAETVLKLARSNQELEQFAFVASHDLQEPLRKIRQFGNILQQKLQGRLDEETQDSFQRILSATERMQVMIDDLLELSRVNSQEQPFVPVDLAQVAAEVVSDLEPLLLRTGGQVVCELVRAEPLPWVEADPIQMHQLFQNLIGNALKFHRSGTPPMVKVSGTVAKSRTGKGEVVSIQVQDNGIGFEEKQFEQVLQPFQRLHGRSEYEGTGMGLAIVKKIVERHHGEISARSTPGEGSTFIITLPVKGKSS